MGLLDLFRSGNAKTPLAIATAQHAQGMDASGWLGPGTPLTPVRGYSGTPRAMDYPTGINTATRSREAWKGRTSYEILRAMLRAYDVAQACMNHKIDEIRSMEPLFTPVDGAEGDTKLAVEAARAALAYPDREHPYDEWLSMWLVNMLTFDSGPLKKRRNRRGEIMGLEIIDGATVFPYIDGSGRRPKAPAPAYYQITQGQTEQEFTAEDIVYPRFRPQTDSPFGMAPLETVMMAVNTDMRLQWHFLQMFTAGNIPGGFMEAPPDLSSPDQINEFQDYWNATFDGDQENKHKVVFVPAGSNFHQTVPDAFDKEFPRFLMLKTCAAYGVVPQDLGYTDDVNRACYSADTETLTESGWKTYDQIGPDERIATFNPDSGQIEFHVPEKKYVYPFKGDMVHFSSKNVDVLVTPEHRMWAKLRRVSDPWQKITAEELEATNGDFKFASSGEWAGREIDSVVIPAVGGSKPKPERTVPMDLWLEFLGYVISEGCIYQPKDVDNQRNRYGVSLSQSTVVNPEKVEIIDRCISALPFAFKSYVDSEGTKRWQVSDKPLWNWLNDNVGQKSHTKRVPQSVRNVSARQLRILLDAMMLGDGTVDKRTNATSTTYYTNSYELAGNVQEIAAKLGLRAQIGEGTRCYRVMMKPDTGSQLRSSKNVSREAYDGFVWCFHVKNHLFVTRRNGKVTIQGNTGETQTDTQFRVNTLPWVRFVESHLNRYIQKDLGLPVEVKLNTGRDKEDRLQEAQLWKLAIESGMASMDEGREELFGLPADPLRPVPRGIITPRLGYVPLQSILAISGTVDPETKAPADTVPLSENPFEGTPGLMPDKLPGIDEFKRAPINPDEPSFPELERNHPETGTVAKPAPAAPAVAKSAESTDVDKEMAQFNAFRKTRAKLGKWRDFEFTTVHKSAAEALNAQARIELVKDDHAGTDARPKAGTPSWRDAPPNAQPQHMADLALTDYWAPQIKDSLMDLWSEADLSAAVTATNGIGDVGLSVFRDVARRVLNGSVQPSTLEQVITNAWADAYNAGTMAATVQMGSIPTGWGDWRPGMTDANKITAIEWKETLQASGHTIKDITDTTLNRLAYKIADGVNAGDPSDVIARALNEVLDDPARSVMIAQTETARMLTHAAMAQYQALGVTQWDWITSAGACPSICIPGAAAGPYTVNQDALIPAHPYCRCAASPHIQEGHTL